MERRTFLEVAATIVGARLLSIPRRRRPANTRLILLGTAGGPRPRAGRSAPAQVIVVNNAAYVIDCGDGVARQLVLARVPLATLRNVFITHHHSDHNADYGNLLLLAWAAGLRTHVDTWGPPPIERMTSLFFEMNATDIDARIADEGRIPLGPLVQAHNVQAGGVIMQDDNVRVTAAVVNHPPMATALAYRFDAPDRSIVISGDTTPSDNLVRLARDADILVHEALYAPAVEQMIKDVANASDLRRSIMSHHTTIEDAGRIAHDARVKTLVLSHLVPAEDPVVPGQTWIDAARRHFAGRIIVGKDLLEI
jgi:ribonuclease BN (tRNA processing enzyme)